jgi:hypothetical protein
LAEFTLIPVPFIILNNQGARAAFYFLNCIIEERSEGKRLFMFMTQSGLQGLCCKVSP